MAFETRPFNLGNTLRDAAAIETMRHRNTLLGSQIQERNAINEALQAGATPNEIARLNVSGLGHAQGMTDLESSISNLGAAESAQALRRAAIAHRAASVVASSKNPAQAALIALKDPGVAEIFGNIDPSTMDPEVLRQEAAQIADSTSFAIDPQRVAEMQRGRSVIIETPEGPAFATETFDPRTNESSVNVAQIPGTLTNQSGETPQQRQRREVETAGGKRVATTAAERDAEFIEVGQRQADSTAILRRGLQLLDLVNTGRPQEIALAARTWFGIAGADETELNANLGKAILAQLRQVFGAQFTEREGSRLEFIEANFGKSTEGNRRLLEQALQVAERDARRGFETARRIGQTFDADEIQRSLKFELETLGQPQQQTQQIPDGVIDLGGGVTLTPIFD